MKNSVSVAVPQQRAYKISFRLFPFMRQKELSDFKEFQKVYGRLIIIKGPLNLFCLKIYSAG